MPSVLLIDDDDPLRGVIAEILRGAGYKVNEAPDGTRALALFKAEPAEVVITDIVMPDMDGLEFIVMLSHYTPRPRVIAMSGDAQMAESLYFPTARKLGIQGALVKPIRAADLLETVARVLAEPLYV